MSYAVIKTGGKQYKVKSGEIIKIEKLPDSKPETKIEFNEILAYGDDKSIEIGTPNVEGAKVEANLIKNSKNRTILIFKFSLSYKIITPTTKQSQGLMIAKLFPTEQIVSCCSYQNGENIYLVSKQGKIFCLNSNEIYYANEYSLGYLNEKTQIKNDYFLKILPSNYYLDVETNKNKSARLDFDKLNFKSNKTNFLIDFLKLDKGEYLENCFRLENFLT